MRRPAIEALANCYFCISSRARTHAFITSSNVIPAAILQWVKTSFFLSHCATRSPWALYSVKPFGRFGGCTRVGCVAGGSVTLSGCTAGPLAVAAKRQKAKKVCTGLLQVFGG